MILGCIESGYKLAISGWCYISTSFLHSFSQTLNIAPGFQKEFKNQDHHLHISGYCCQSLEQTSAGTQHIASTMQEQSAFMEEMLGTANQVNEMVENLKGQIAHFKIK